ncbi:HAD family hydrolase [Vibrio stylophorae]|nr:HAD family hydrolase [Vibrio stylophorae]
MTTPDIRLIASDMDGTLLDEQARLAPEFFDLFHQLKAQDIIFAAASGRQYYSLLETFAPVKDEMMFIAENGTLVMHQGQELYSCTIARDEIHAIVAAAREIENAYVVLCGKRSAYIETQAPEALAEFQKYYQRCEYVPDLLAVEDDFIKVAICHFGGTEALVYPSIYGQFGNTHQVVVSAKIWLDVMNAQASKGAAIEHLHRTMQFGPENTMSFGDYLNDLEMLNASGYSYAMANAHDAIKAAARFEAPSNAERGVLQVIEQLLAGEISGK